MCTDIVCKSRAIDRSIAIDYLEEQSIAEARRFGMAVIQFRKKDYISDYYKRQRKDAQNQLPQHE
jgi:hypothetical protein